MNDRKDADTRARTRSELSRERILRRNLRADSGMGNVEAGPRTKIGVSSGVGVNPPSYAADQLRTSVGCRLHHAFGCHTKITVETVTAKEFTDFEVMEPSSKVGKRM